MSLIDWLSDSLGLGGGPNGGTPMQPGPGSMVGDIDPMGNPTGQMGPMPTAAPGTTPPLMPVQPDNMDPANRGMTPPMPPQMAMNATPIDLPPRAVPDPATQAMPGGQGGPAPAVPLPQARPPGAPGAPPTDISAASAPPAAPMNLAPPGAIENFAPSMSPGNKGGGTAKGILESALGLSPERATRVRGNLGAGLKAVGENANKPGLAAFAGSMGSGIEGGTKSDEKQTDQRTKLLSQMISAQGKGDQAAYVKAQTEYTKVKMATEKAKMADPNASKKPQAAAFTEEQKLFKINDAIAKDPRIKAAKENLVTLQKQGSRKDVTAAQKTLDDLVSSTKKDLNESLRSGSKTNPYKVTSQQDLEKVAQPGDIYINPADGKPYVFKGAKKDATTASGMTPAAAPETADEDAE